MGPGVQALGLILSRSLVVDSAAAPRGLACAPVIWDSRSLDADSRRSASLKRPDRVRQTPGRDLPPTTLRESR